QLCTQSKCAEPRFWDTVNEECRKEKQSPINIVTNKVKYKEDLKPFTFEGYNTNQSSRWRIENNGHTVKVSLSGSAKIGGGGLRNKYNAIEFHFHWGAKISEGFSPGSEHSIDGERYAMELHIVHRKESFSTTEQAVADQEGLAVLGFFIKVKVRSQQNMTSLPLESLIPAKENLTRYYRYSGSLTTPNCHQAVVWTIFQDPIILSDSQVENFSKKLYFSKDETLHMTDNFRPVQPLNDRIVYYSDVSVVQPPAKALLVVPTLIYILSLLFQ
uniref:Carbonic anhydrase n=1 Tax=Chelonoidis abingdonii TaxID=106734 RepID=A0A8C0GFA0_CHEAB